jgi:hypothetical protein
MQRWVNTYYIPQFDHLVTGYRGRQARNCIQHSASK